MAAPNLGRVGIWTDRLDNQPMTMAREAAAEIEELGYGALWFPEATGREAMSQAGLLLSATQRIVVATGVASIYARDAVSMAAGQRTLTEAFPERFLLGLGVSHPTLVEHVRSHHFGPPLATMRTYLDAMDNAPFDPPVTSHRMLGALGPGMLGLAAERAWGAFPLGMPVQHTANTRALVGPDTFLAVAQVAVLDHDLSRARDLARSFVSAFLPNRHTLLRELGYDEADLAHPAGDRLVNALIAHGDTDHIACRVQEHLDAGADHVALHVLTADPNALPTRQWRELANHEG